MFRNDVKSLYKERLEVIWVRHLKVKFFKRVTRVIPSGGNRLPSGGNRLHALEKWKQRAESWGNRLPTLEMCKQKCMHSSNWLSVEGNRLLA